MKLEEPNAGKSTRLPYYPDCGGVYVLTDDTDDVLYVRASWRLCSCASQLTAMQQDTFKAMGLTHDKAGVVRRSQEKGRNVNIRFIETQQHGRLVADLIKKYDPPWNKWEMLPEQRLRKCVERGKPLSDASLAFLLRAFGSPLSGGDFTRLSGFLERCEKSRRLARFTGGPGFGIPVTEPDAAALQGLFGMNASQPPEAETVHRRLTDPFAKVLFSLLARHSLHRESLTVLVRGVLHASVGICACQERELELYQFGRSLADPTEPVADHYTITGFRLLDAINSGIRPSATHRSGWSFLAQDLYDYKDWLACIPCWSVNVRLIDRCVWFLGKAALSW